jgi:hypothetical protein
MANEEGIKGAKVKFKKVVEKEPWNVFAEQGDIKTSEVTVKAADVAVIAKAYHKFGEDQSPILGSCISCGRRFKKPSQKNIDEGASALIGVGRGHNRE